MRNIGETPKVLEVNKKLRALLCCLLVFKAVSLRAMERKIPYIYISANSGARIGLADELKFIFNVAWEDINEPEKVGNVR